MAGEAVVLLHTGSGSGLFHLHEAKAFLMISTEQYYTKVYIGKNRI